MFAAPSAGVGKLVDLALPEDQLHSDNHLSVWELGGSRAQIPAFPREVNDLQFLSTPASADIDGDGQEELLNGSAYSDLHAFYRGGTEPGLNTLSPTGWPKFTGGWTVGPPAVGDFDGDGTRDVAHSIREGRLFVWNGNGADDLRSGIVAGVRTRWLEHEQLPHGRAAPARDHESVCGGVYDRHYAFVDSAGRR